MRVSTSCLNGAGGGIRTLSIKLMYLHPTVSSQFLSPLFSLLGSFACLVKKSLAGEKLIESENSQLPSLWQDFIRRCLEREEICYLEKRQVPSVWQPETVERRKKENCFWRSATLLLSRMRSSFFEVVSCSSFDSFFFQNVFESKVLEKKETVTDIERNQVEGQ